MSLSAADIVKQVRDLPSLPTVVTELLASMGQSDIDVHVLASKIAMDQALTAKTLRLANSSFYGMSSKITTIDQAIAVLGIHSIRTLVTACAITGSFSAAEAIDLKLFWRHALATAICARLLAPHMKLNPDTAFTTGLLHDIGALVLATRFPADYARVQAHRIKNDCYVLDAEQAVFGLDHSSAGSALAAHWKFPAAMQEAVALHHDSAGHIGTAPAPTLARLVQAANVLAHALDLAGDEAELVPPMPDQVWQALALSDADCAELFAGAESTYKDLCQILLP